MKTAGSLFVILLVLCVLCPLAPGASETGASFRDRLSDDSVELASDVAEEVRFGREVAARVIARYGLYENPGLMRYVNLVGHSISLMTNRPELKFHFAILDTEEINAYAAPGGYVFITRGALLKMEDEAELAGVIAHEMGHIVEKHVVKELHIQGADESATMGLAAMIGGTSQSARTAFSQAVDQTLDMLFKNGYKRADETESDRDAVMFCAFTGYDPSGLVKYFERLDTIKGKNTKVLDKTHPSYKTRIAWLKETITQEGMDSGSYSNHKKRFDAAMKKGKKKSR
jgi:predicted Zn-dependent protease